MLEQHTNMKMTLTIAGEMLHVLFDGKQVTNRYFPDMQIEYTAPCGTRITQEMLVQVCKRKLQQID